eukprot:TRINITY_DN57234_c0_g1_i1.p1 TRINITY_DN57234_c0_g1~~TRINITY_DN57234_c0_g1_i1.p1  ORF type:complete len:122 (+),score=27.28 TRINITY_DN57234_c0_g1_i1:42-407(+)
MVVMCIYKVVTVSVIYNFFFFQAEDGIRDAQESRGLGDVYKRQLGSKAFDTEMLYQQACLLEESNRPWQVILKCHHSLNNQTVVPLGLQKVSCLNADSIVLPLRGMAVSYTHLTLPTKRIV